jgi:uncharacterized protein (TIGR03067 family)
LVLASSALTHGGEPAEKEFKLLQGTWKLESAVSVYGPVPEKDLPNLAIAFDGNKLIYKVDGKLLRAGTAKLDPSKSPKSIDFTVTEGDDKGLLVGIYKLDADKLTICLEFGGKKRPTEFKAGPKMSTDVSVYKRAKK